MKQQLEGTLEQQQKRGGEKKSQKKPWLLGAGLRQGHGLGSGWGLCLGLTGLEKAPGAGGLRINTAGGAQECLWPWRAEDQVQDPSWLPGQEWAGEVLDAFPSNPPILEGPSPLASLLLPTPCPMPLGPTQPEGAPEGRGPDPEAHRLPELSGQGICQRHFP